MIGTRLLLGILLLAPAVFAQECTTRGYTSDHGTVQLSYNIEVTGDPSCSIGSVTNSLPWTITTSGVATCPVDLNTQGNRGDGSPFWEYNPTYTSDSGGGSN